MENEAERRAKTKEDALNHMQTVMEKLDQDMDVCVQYYTYNTLSAKEYFAQVGGYHNISLKNLQLPVGMVDAGDDAKEGKDDNHDGKGEEDQHTKDSKEEDQHTKDAKEEDQQTKDAKEEDKQTKDAKEEDKTKRVFSFSSKLSSWMAVERWEIAVYKNNVEFYKRILATSPASSANASECQAEIQVLHSKIDNLQNLMYEATKQQTKMYWNSFVQNRGMPLAIDGKRFKKSMENLIISKMVCTKMVEWIKHQSVEEEEEVKRVPNDYKIIDSAAWHILDRIQQVLMMRNDADPSKQMAAATKVLFDLRQRFIWQAYFPSLGRIKENLPSDDPVEVNKFLVQLRDDVKRERDFSLEGL